jgi:DNA-binding CsgD family transcriptional regulator
MNAFDALGLRIADRESRFDALPGVVDGLLELYDRPVVARWLYAWWRASGEPHVDSLPERVRTRVGADALAAAVARDRRARHARAHARTRLVSLGVMRPARYGPRSLIDVRRLAEMIEAGMDNDEIAREFNVTVGAVVNKRRQIGLPSPTTRRPIDVERLTEMYEAGASDVEIADALRVRTSVIARKRRRLGLLLPNVPQPGSARRHAERIEALSAQGWSSRAIALVLGIGESTVRRIRAEARG